MGRTVIRCMHPNVLNQHGTVQPSNNRHPPKGRGRFPKPQRCPLPAWLQHAPALHRRPGTQLLLLQAATCRRRCQGARQPCCEPTTVAWGSGRLFSRKEHSSGIVG